MMIVGNMQASDSLLTSGKKLLSSMLGILWSSTEKLDTSGRIVKNSIIPAEVCTEPVVITSVITKNPTSPCAMDGEITFSATPVGKLIAYFLNGDGMGPTDEGTVTYENLGVGVYTLRAVLAEPVDPACFDETERTLTTDIVVGDPFIRPAGCNRCNPVGLIRLDENQVTCGQPPYQYTIGECFEFIPVGEAFRNLKAGIYELIVIDSQGTLSEPKLVEVAQLEKVKICKVCTTPAHCPRNDGSICVKAKSATGTLQYSRDHGRFQDDPCFCDLAPGTYKVTVNQKEDPSGSCNACAIVKVEAKKRKRPSNDC